MVHPALDDIDLAILRELQGDGRLSNADLARRIGLSPPATHARVRRLERDGVVARYVALAGPGGGRLRPSLLRQRRAAGS